MSVYPDTSLLVALFVSETGSTAADTWLREARLQERICCSGWTNAEFLSAVGNRRRRGELSGTMHLGIVEAWRDMASSFDTVPVGNSAFADAARWLATPKLGLRAGDALHLAIAKAAGATVWTLDNRMFTAGQALGLAVNKP